MYTLVSYTRSEVYTCTHLYPILAGPNTAGGGSQPREPSEDVGCGRESGKKGC